MRIVEVVKTEDCFDGSYIREFVVDSEITEQAVMSLAKIGELEYYPEFPRPFFKITQKNRVHLKGVVGEKSFKAVFSIKLSCHDFDSFCNELGSALFKAA